MLAFLVFLGVIIIFILKINKQSKINKDRSSDFSGPQERQQDLSSMIIANNGSDTQTVSSKLSEEKEQSNWTAFFLSLLFSGMGQIYQRKIGLGLTYTISAAISALVGLWPLALIIQLASAIHALYGPVYYNGKANIAAPKYSPKNNGYHLDGKQQYFEMLIAKIEEINNENLLNTNETSKDQCVVKALITFRDQIRSLGLSDYTDGIILLKTRKLITERQFDLFFNADEANTQKNTSSDSEPIVTRNLGAVMIESDYSDIEEKIRDIADQLSEGRITADEHENEQLRTITELTRKSKMNGDQYYQSVVRQLVVQRLLDKQFISLAESIYQSL